MDKRKVVKDILFEDCTLIKLGGGVAITLPKKKLSANGLVAGMSVNVRVSLNSSESDEVVFYDQDIAHLELFLKDYAVHSVEEISRVASQYGYYGLRKGEDVGVFKANTFEALSEELEFMVKEMKQLDASLRLAKDGVEEFDYAVQGAAFIPEEDVVAEAKTLINDVDPSTKEV